MSYLLGDTIAAIATPSGAGGVGMVRISGPDAAAIADHIFRRGRNGGRPNLVETLSHRLVYGRIVDPATEATIDEVLLGWMRAPHSSTRQDTVEITCHGGGVALRETLRATLASGARHAEPGEFTLRAFLNGRLDLTQAEAVLDIVGARTPEALRLAVADLGGGLAARIGPARAATISALAYLDAAADFPDDEIPPADVDADLDAAATALAEVLAGARAGMLLRDGARVALVGRPNVGKSSLLNALLRTDRAIVTPIAGTTRDVIAETISIGGIPVTLLDTAGIGETEDEIERLGIERSQRALAGAGAVVLVLDGSVAPSVDDQAVVDLLTDRLPADAIGAAPVVIVMNKHDLAERADQGEVVRRLPGCRAIEVSCVTGAGIEEVEAALAEVLGGEAMRHGEPSLLTVRQHAALERAHGHIRDAVRARREGFPLDLLATDVRAAARAIGQVTGEEIDEAVLDEIFSRFCIGK